MLLAAVILTILCIFFLFLIARKPNFGWSLGEIRSMFGEHLENPLDTDSILAFLTLVLVLVLPLIWGLAFYLRTDANVLVVLIFLVWTYNCLKYIFFYPEEGTDSD